MNDVNDLRVIKTLENIKNGFAICIKEKKFSSITVKDIVNAAKINRSTFYRYYEDKYHLREALVKEALEEIKTNITLEEFKNLDNQINVLIEELEFMYRNREWHLILWNKNMELYVFEDMQKVFEKSMKTNIIKNKNFDFINNIPLIKKQDLFAKLFAASAMTTMKWWYEVSPDISSKEVAKIILNSINHGMIKAFF